MDLIKKIEMLLNEDLKRLLSGAYGYEINGEKWEVLDYEGNKVLLGRYKERGKIGKMWYGDIDKFATKWIDMNKIKKGIKKGEIKEIPIPKVKHVAR